MPDRLSLIALGLPKGRMQDGILALLREAGIGVRLSSRGYRPTLSVDWLTAKLLKPQNIIEMLQVGSRDVGFAGADWVAELGASDVVELLDTGLDPVRIVAAAPSDLLVDGALPQRPLLVASELERLTTNWIARTGIAATFVRSYGSTEAFPPDDADLIVDIAATGDTLRANRLEVCEVLLTSSTRLYAHKGALADPAKARSIEALVLLLRSALNARERVMVEVNVGAEELERVVAILPCMREPTVAQLHRQAGYAVKAAVLRRELPDLIPRIKAAGGTDIVVFALDQIIP